MDYTMNERLEYIKKECLNTKEADPVKLFYKIAGMDFVRIHGPEHHFLDGACILTAFYNAGSKIGLEEALGQLMGESVKMPGAMCGMWGVCGAVTSVGAALAIIDNTGPLSKADWGLHMQYTSRAVLEISKTGGPRCCKRDGFFAIKTGIEFLNENYDINIPLCEIKCAFSHRNEQCLGKRCPFYGEN